MTDEILVGYATGALDPSERNAVEIAAASSPDVASRLDRIRALLSPLAIDRADPEIPAGLADRTIARLASVRDRVPLTRPEPTRKRGPRRFHGESIIAVGIACLVFGLAAVTVIRLRFENELLACQNNLRVLHAGLSGYADTHDDRFPQVGVESHSTAGSFVQTLLEAGQYPPSFRPVCPASREQNPETESAYAYSLGYRSASGELAGLRRGGGLTDLMPISADYPTEECSPEAGPVSPHNQLMNVLLVSGSVRPTTTPLIGPDGDDIYRNREGRIAAGLDGTDSVLGRGSDTP